MSDRRGIGRFGPTLVDPIEIKSDGHTALLIIDMQYRDVPDPDAEVGGWMDALSTLRPLEVEQYVMRMHTTVIPSIGKLLGAFRARALPVVHTVFGSRHPDYLDLPTSLRRVVFRLEESSGVRGFVLDRHAGSRVRTELSPAQGEPVVRKTTWSAFVGTHLDDLLRRRGVENLVITGVTTAGCVGATARHAADLGYMCVIVADGTGDDDPELHDSSLVSFHRKHGRVVQSADEVIDAIVNNVGV